ncbi:aldo/keto reductase [bacterium]|nr:aldo/keto reductase [bacterium]
MRYKLFGASGLRVSELCLGCMTFGEEWGSGVDKAESRKVFDTFAEAGGNFLDTANLYTEGTSETYVGEFIAAERERFVVATKYSLSTRHDDPNAAGMHRKNLVQSLESSLRRLDTEYVDILYVHAWDGLARVHEVMRALDDQVRLGKVLHVAVSDTPAWLVARANTMAQDRGWTPFTGLQLKYSLLERTPERDLLPMARYMDLAVTTWGSLGGGQLSGKYLGRDAGQRRRADEVDTRRRGIDAQVDDRSECITRELIDVAEQIGCTPNQAALAWVKARSAPLMIPIVGARTADQLRENLGCLEVTFTTEQLEGLSEVSAIDLGFPHEFLRKDSTRTVLHGEFADRIDAERRGD